MVLLTFDVNDPSFTNSAGDISAVSNAGVILVLTDVLFSTRLFCLRFLGFNAENYFGFQHRYESLCGMAGCSLCVRWVLFAVMFWGSLGSCAFS